LLKEIHPLGANFSPKFEIFAIWIYLRPHYYAYRVFQKVASLKLLEYFYFGKVFLREIPQNCWQFISTYTYQFSSHVSTLTRDINIANLSTRLSVRPSVRDVPVLDENGLTHRHSYFHHTVAQSF